MGLPSPAFALIFDGSDATEQSKKTLDGDIPVQRFRKDLIALGTFKHPVHGWKLKVTRDRAKLWVAAFDKMLAAGCEMAVNRDHLPGVDNHVGYLVGMEFKDNRLFGIIEARGEQAIKDCLRVNRVSIEVLPDYVDGKGVHYGEAVVGLAITANPVASGQSGFVPIAASTESVTAGPAFTFEGETAVDFAELTKLLGADATEDNCVDLVTAALKDRDDKITAATEATTAETAKVKALEAAGTESEFSLDPDTADVLAEGIEARIEGLVACSAVNPDVGKKLGALLAGAEGARPAMLLSRKALGKGAEQSLARRIVDVLKDNKLVETGERTGVQVLSRTVPDGTTEQPGLNPEVNAEMILMANGGVEAKAE